MHRVVAYAVGPGGGYDVLEHMHGVYLWLQAVGEHGAVVHGLWIHDHYGHGDSAAAELQPLVEHGHGQVVGADVLEGASYLVAAHAVGGCLYHGGDSRSFRQATLIGGVIAAQGGEVDLQHRLVLAGGEHLGDLF